MTRVTTRFAPDVTLIQRLASGRVSITVLVIALIAYFVYFSIRQIVSPFEPIGDAAEVFERSRRVFDLGDYPARLSLGNMADVFPYSPSGVLLIRSIAIEPTLYTITWLMLMAAGFLVTLRASVVQERSELQAIWPLIGIVALIFAGAPIEWDLRIANSNLIYLGFVLAGYALLDRRPLVAGILVGLSISLKLYSGLLMVWLLVYGPRKAFYAGAVTMVVLWLILPVAVFGIDGAIQIYLGWQEQIRILADPWIYALLAHTQGPPMVTLKRAAMAIFGEGPDATPVQLLVLALQAIWMSALVWYAYRASRQFPVMAPSRVALADWTILLLAPLPFSPWFEPYHAVPIIVGTILCLAVAADELAAQRTRLIAFGAVVLVALMRVTGAPFSLRGLVLLAQFLVLLIALGLLRPKLERVAQPAMRAGGVAVAR